jgi:hypothetical protein
VVAAMIAAIVVLGIGLYVERSYEGDEIAQVTVAVLALILAGAAWFMEHRLLRQQGPETKSGRHSMGL